MTTTTEPTSPPVNTHVTGGVADGLRHTFGTFTTGVAVVTIGDAEPHGITVNSLSSVSLCPPLISVCIDRRAAIHDRLPSSDFAVSILAAGQEQVACYFADSSRPRGFAEFANVPHRVGVTCAAPLLSGALAHVECRPWQCFDGGDHTVVIGEVVWHATYQGVPPLTFFQGRFYDGSTVPVA